MIKRCSLNSSNEGEVNSETIPFDLIIEIFTRLPAKSIARFRCVSKLWESIFRSPNFTESFFTISSSCPKILFTCQLHGKTLFFSSTQPRNSSPLAVNFHMSFPINFSYEISRPVSGLVCGLNHGILNNGNAVIVPLICNPSTGQSLALPTLPTNYYVKCFIGYDPANKQFKVLCIKYCSQEFQVLTLGTGKKLSWTRIKCDIPHYLHATMHSKGHYVYDGVCINGVLYYLASILHGGGIPHIVCFDIRSEKFKRIRRAQGMGAIYQSILVNYKSKLATLQPNIVDRIYTGIQLWVLEDADNHQWSSFTYVLPPPWNNIYAEKKLYFVGMTSIGEIVLSPPNYLSDSFYLVYYNPETKNITKVEIEGMEAFKSCTSYTFLDHVEDVKLMAAV